MSKNIILSYKEEEKIINNIPDNYIDLKDYFLSLYDENNDEIYLFGFLRSGESNKIVIGTKDDLFKKSINEIVQNNYKIYIKDVREIKEEDKWRENVIEVKENTNEMKKDEKEEGTNENNDDELDEFFSDANASTKIGNNPITKNENNKELDNFEDSKTGSKVADNPIKKDEDNDDELDDFFSDATASTKIGNNPIKKEESKDNFGDSNAKGKEVDNPLEKEEKTSKTEDKTDNNDIKKLKEELLIKDEKIKEMELKMKKLEDELNLLKKELNETKDKNCELTMKINGLEKTNEKLNNYIEELESKDNE